MKSFAADVTVQTFEREGAAVCGMASRDERPVVSNRQKKAQKKEDKAAHKKTIYSFIRAA